MRQAIAIARASAEHLPEPLLRRLLQVHQISRLSWATKLAMLENPVLIAPLSGDKFQALLQHRTKMFNQSITEFDLIALAYERRFGPVAPVLGGETL